MPVPKSYSFTDAVFNVTSDPARQFEFVSFASQFLLISAALLVAYVLIDVWLKHRRDSHDNE